MGIKNTLTTVPVFRKRRIQFARIHSSFPIDIEKILNRLITKFYNGNDVTLIAAELRLTKTRLIFFIRNITFIRNNASRCKHSFEN